ncbi:hypothetical protein FDP41_002198 [Naegleria fowleri]|uniref:Histidine kinase n=1 Tax=Naegleria fowleri TaxID=5763 RepID=A0A6A5BZP2_NAEFO|nr:uncharacterized protein FDP41_002198 [Naegleria fowleri]KAF0979128.1 hypothetical protein FDP41_002198 [Naegleria fowleri]
MVLITSCACNTAECRNQQNQSLPSNPNNNNHPQQQSQQQHQIGSSSTCSSFTTVQKQQQERSRPTEEKEFEGADSSSSLNPILPPSSTSQCLNHPQTETIYSSSSSPPSTSSSPSNSPPSMKTTIGTTNNTNTTPSDVLLKQLLHNQKMQAQIGSKLSFLPLLFGLTFCWERGPLLFFMCTVGELTFHFALNSRMRKHVKSIKSFVQYNSLRLVVVVILQWILQLYYGHSVPLHVFHTYKILISANVFYNNLRWFYVNTILLLGSNLIGMYVAFLTERDKMTEEQTRAFYQRLVEVFILQYSVVVGSYLFSSVMSSKTDESTQHLVEVERERVKNSEKTKFIANLSHEARNPLHCIMGSLQVLNHHFEGEKCLNGCKHCFLNNSAINEIIEDIKENATLLLHILSSSLQMTSLEMGKIKLKHEPFNLKFLLDSLIGVFSQLAHEKQISLHCFFNVSKVPQLLKGDSVRLSQIIMNIISNAIKYTKKGYVRVNCDLANDEDLKSFDNHEIMIDEHNENMIPQDQKIFVKLEFIDTGCGISQEQIQKIFQPYHIIDEHQQNEDFSLGFEQYFNHSENMNKLSDGGSSLINTNRNGLGLSITKLLINKMNGHIKVSSTLNVGTNVTILLPLENTLNDSSEVISEILRGDDVKDIHVLVVDQDECFQTVLQSYLKLFTKVRKIECRTSVESLETQPLPGGNMVKVIFVPEGDYSRVTQLFSNGTKENDSVIITPTIFKGSQRSYPHLKYLSKPVKFSEIVDVLSNDKMFLKENNVTKQPLKDNHVLAPSSTSFMLPTKDITTTSPLSFQISPRLHDQAAQHDTATTCVRTFDFASISVLIADDNAVNRKVLMKMLQIIGFKDIDTSNDGMECFEKFKQKAYQLVLLDCYMPILSGREACEMIRNLEKQGNSIDKEYHHKRVPIIAITANTWEPRDTLLSQGFDDVVYKPVILEQFRQLLLKYLDRQEFTTASTKTNGNDISTQEK